MRYLTVRNANRRPLEAQGDGDDAVFFQSIIDNAARGGTADDVRGEIGGALLFVACFFPQRISIAKIHDQISGGIVACRFSSPAPI